MAFAHQEMKTRQRFHTYVLSSFQPHTPVVIAEDASMQTKLGWEQSTFSALARKLKLKGDGGAWIYKPRFPKPFSTQWSSHVIGS